MVNLKKVVLGISAGVIAIAGIYYITRPRKSQAKSSATPKQAPQPKNVPQGAHS